MSFITLEVVCNFLVLIRGDSSWDEEETEQVGEVDPALELRGDGPYGKEQSSQGNLHNGIMGDMTRLGAAKQYNGLARGGGGGGGGGIR